MNIKQKKHSLFGRPSVPEEDKRSVKFSVFCTPPEAQEIDNRCTALKMTRADLFRRAALGRKIQAQRSTFDLQALDELRMIGQNVNQIARELARVKNENLSFDEEILMNILQSKLAALNELKTRIFEQE